MNEAELIQGSPEWRAARCGSVGASQISDLVAKTKTGWGAGRANLMGTLIAERLTGVPAESYTNAAMAWGTDHEEEARNAYQWFADVEVKQVGLIRHPRIDKAHASPDGLIGDDGLLELKCPQTSTHIETLLGQAVANKYFLQAQWQMACTGRNWVDWASYDPRMPDDMRLFVKRIYRNDEKIAELERDVIEFLTELDRKLFQLSALYVRPPVTNVLLAG